MLLVVTTPTESFSAKHSSIVLALVQRIPDGMTNLPRIVLLPRTSGLFRIVVMSSVKRAVPNGLSPGSVRTAESGVSFLRVRLSISAAVYSQFSFFPASATLQRLPPANAIRTGQNFHKDGRNSPLSKLNRNVPLIT